MKMKRKLIAPLIALFLCVSMIGIGFAGWVITTTTSRDGEAGFTVYSVQDKRYAFNVASSSGVTWGYGTTTAQTPWLLYDTTGNDKMTSEVLTAKFTLVSTTSLSSGDTVTYVVSGVNVTPDASSNECADWKAAVDSKYVAAAPNIAGSYEFTISGTNVSIMKDSTAVENKEDGDVYATFANNKLTVVFYAKFNWGTASGGQNPYTFFNNKTGDATYNETGVTLRSGITATGTNNAVTYSDVAKDMLTYINALSDVKYTVTVTGSRNAAAN